MTASQRYNRPVVRAVPASPAPGILGPDPRRAFLLKDITAEDRALLERGLAAAAAEDDDA